MDLNRFKVFNDALGHDVGDLLLVAAAQRLAHCVPNEGFIARLGGDEFIIVAPLQGIDQLTRQLISQFETPFALKSIASNIRQHRNRRFSGRWNRRR
ncbi:GGDEF domain-containing protein [Bacillus licheniformis]|nr:GGDEF domain-containing protein [Bacillus licheniformis]